MSDKEEAAEGKDFVVEIAKQGRAKCKECKEPCPAKELRIAKLAFSPFSSEKVKQWHHLNCLFNRFLKQRPATKRIENTDDIDGLSSIPEDDKKKVIEKINECNDFFEKHHHVKPKSPKKVEPTPSVSKELKHYQFRDFRKLVAEIASVNSYLDKTELVRNFFKNFEGDVTLWCKLLLPGVVKRIYNLQSKQLVKIFSRIFKLDQNKMLEHLEQGDVAETISYFYENNHTVKPTKKSIMTVEEVNSFLNALSQLTKEEEQTLHFQNLLKKCTSNDLMMIIRLIKHDLRMNAGAKHILDGVHQDAYQAYQSSRDIELVIARCSGESQKNSVKAAIAVMTPVLPMLAEACKSVEMAMKKCPNGMFSEIKYDGERVQVHKKGTEFKYFSRSLKPVLPHKVAHFKEFIPKAFPYGNNLILDSEILAIDTVTKQPLPFGSLGKHKKEEYENASVCLYIFDCIFYNGEDLTKKPIKERKKILDENMIEVPDKILFSEMKIIHKPDDLRQMIAKVLQLGLEGLVLKDLNSIYEPGKRHWLKVKKDYLFDGAMADSADLIVLGAWYGTGKKGGKMSVFLMGCHDKNRDVFVTVSKVHTGHDDATLERLQTELKMKKISCDSTKVPPWLRCTKTMIPDFVAVDPKQQPVWEITGAEFTQHDVHTANGISIRFPRVTKIRDDKDWRTATSLDELKELFRKSKEGTDVGLLINGLTDKRKLDSDQPEPSPKKIKLGPQIFKNIKLYVSGENLNEWVESFTKHGGMVVDYESIGSATHILHLRDHVMEIDRNYPKFARNISYEWIKRSVESEKLLNWADFSVKWTA